MSYTNNDDDKLFETIISFTLSQEGGYVKDDPNGPTKFGISQKFLDAHNLITLAPSRKIKNLTLDIAKRLYRSYFYKSYIRDIARTYSLKVAVRLFDITVNMGEFRANVLLQRTVNQCLVDSITIDGIIGPQTLSKLKMCNVEVFYDIFIQNIILYYKSLGKSDKYKKYVQGWLNRAYTPIEDFLYGKLDNSIFMVCPNCGLYLLR